MTNLILKVLMGDKYKVFGISSAICLGSFYVIFNTSIYNVYLNCTGMTFGICSAPIMGWNLARIKERD